MKQIRSRLRLARTWLSRRLRRLNDRIRGVVSFAEANMLLLTFALLIVVIIVSARYWGESEGVRNFGLIIAAIIALPVAIWRSRVAERQADAAQQGVLNERYQRAAEMLGSKEASVRLGGIFTLTQLAQDYPAIYHPLVVNLLVAFIREPAGDRTTANRPGTILRYAPHDVQAAVHSLSICRAENRSFETNELVILDLRGADLRNADLTSIDLSPVQTTDTRLVLRRPFALWGGQANLTNANLSGARLWMAKAPRALASEANFSKADLSHTEFTKASFLHANFTDADLSRADLSNALLVCANFTGADLEGVNFSGATLTGAKFSEESPGKMGLTQEQLDVASEDLFGDEPPDLGGVVDAKTGASLVWRGGRGDASEKE